MKREEALLQNGEKKQPQGYKRKISRRVKRGVNGIRRIVKKTKP